MIRTGRICKLNCFLKIPLENADMRYEIEELEIAAMVVQLVVRRSWCCCDPLENDYKFDCHIFRHWSYCHRWNSFLFWNNWIRKINFIFFMLNQGRLSIELDYWVDFFISSWCKPVRNTVSLPLSINNKSSSKLV